MHFQVRCLAVTLRQRSVSFSNFVFCVVFLIYKRRMRVCIYICDKEEIITNVALVVLNGVTDTFVRLSQREYRRVRLCVSIDGWLMQRTNRAAAAVAVAAVNDWLTARRMWTLRGCRLCAAYDNAKTDAGVILKRFPWKIRPERDHHGIDTSSPYQKYRRPHKKSPHYRIVPTEKSSPDRQFTGKNPSHPGRFLPVNCRPVETFLGWSYNGAPACLGPPAWPLCVCVCVWSKNLATDLIDIKSSQLRPRSANPSVASM